MPLHPADSARRARLVNAFRTDVPRTPPGDGPPRPPRDVSVFAVGTDWVQVTWRVLGPGPVTISAGGVSETLHPDGGPGAITLRGLAPGCPHTVAVRGPGLGDRSSLSLPAVTLRRPPGERLHRIATVNDTHLGSNSTGFFHTIIEKPEPAVPHPVRCLRAAVAEASAWGADEFLLKGDVVDASTDRAWSDLHDVLRAVTVPVHVIPGNHEWSPRNDTDPARGLADLGHRLIRGVAGHRVPGLQVVMVDTSRPGRDAGQVATVADDVVDLVADNPQPALVAMHHQLMRLRLPTYLPPGIPGPEARRFLSALGRANPRVLVTSGHTHRHRRRRHGPVTVSEVGSTKDFPGTWAGYEVYEHGLVQTVHRIEEPDCIRWTDHTRRAALGVWQYWSPGSIDDRCFTLTW